MPKKTKWSQLQIRSNGTVNGTVIQDQDGRTIGMVQRCIIEFDAEKNFTKAYLELINVPLRLKNIPLEKMSTIAWSEVEQQFVRRKQREARQARQARRSTQVVEKARWSLLAHAKRAKALKSRGN